MNNEASVNGQVDANKDGPEAVPSEQSKNVNALADAPPARALIARHRDEC